MAAFNLIGFLGVLVLAFSGWAGRGYLDSHPGIHFTVPAPVRWVLPASWKHVDVSTLADQRDAALAQAAGAKRCEVDRSSLQAAIAAQNAAVEVLRREGEARVAESAQAVSAARITAASAQARAAQILALAPQGADLCRAADELIVREAGR